MPTTITICERCLWPPRPSERWVPHDGPCGDGCEEGETGCHCGQPQPVEMDRAEFIVRAIDARQQPPTEAQP